VIRVLPAQQELPEPLVRPDHKARPAAQGRPERQVLKATPANPVRLEPLVIQDQPEQPERRDRQDRPGQPDHKGLPVMASS
jgi:hypothetical protein